MDQHNILWGGKVVMYSWTRLWIRLESFYSPEVEQWRCIAGLASWKKTTSDGLINRCREKSFWQTNTCMPGARGSVALLQLKNKKHTWKSSCNWSHHLIKFKIIQASPVFYVGKLLQTSCGDVVVIIIPASFQSLIVMQSLSSLQKCDIGFGLLFS